MAPGFFPRTLAGQITLLALSVALAGIILIAVGVLVIAQGVFSRLMVQAGEPAAVAHNMFTHGVATIFLAAAVIAILTSAALAILLARRLSRPLERMTTAAGQLAAGDYDTRVPRRGPAEIASLANSFNQMAESLSEQERLRREFIVNAAHELRTPLTNLQGYLEALRDGVIAPTPEQFASLHEEADRLVRLSRSLDALADGSARPRAVPQAVDLRQALRSAIEVARPSFEARSISLDVRTPDELQVRAVPDQLAQVLANLLQNASRYTPAGGTVRVAAESRATDAVVSIANDGDGIPAEDLPRVFERFYRVEKSRDRARGGAGIGLAIVKQLVEGAGGHVGADSRPGQTRFWFSLPV